jgi:flavin reductase (DIM6/NTAB) family NADH-FMN oxidoreductase RutF
MDNTMLHFSKDEILASEKQFRTNLINTVSGFKSVCLIGTTNTKGQTNLAIFNSIVHIGAHPPLIGFISRPNTVERHTLNNILSTGVYSINLISSNFYKEAHQTSARYPQHVSEFESTQLKEAYLNDFMAPYVHQSPIKLGMEFKQKIDIDLNQTHLIIGEIQHIYCPDYCLDKEGNLSLEKANIIAGCGLDAYFSTTKLARLQYAKPDSSPTEI